METGEILGAEHLGIERLGVIGCELLIGEVNQNHQATEVFKVKV